MVYKLQLLILNIILGQGGEIMMALLWAQQIINERPGYTYDRVPKRLKEQVKQILIDSGCEELVTE